MFRHTALSSYALTCTLLILQLGKPVTTQTTCPQYPLPEASSDKAKRDAEKATPPQTPLCASRAFARRSLEYFIFPGSAQLRLTATVQNPYTVPVPSTQCPAPRTQCPGPNTPAPQNPRTPAPQHPGTRHPTANLRIKILDLGGFDLNRIFISRAGILMPTGNSLEILSQGILVGIISVGRLGVACGKYVFKAPKQGLESSIFIVTIISFVLLGSLCIYIYMISYMYIYIYIYIYIHINQT